MASVMQTVRAAFIFPTEVFSTTNNEFKGLYPYLKRINTDFTQPIILLSKLITKLFKRLNQDLWISKLIFSLLFSP